MLEDSLEDANRQVDEAKRERANGRGGRGAVQPAAETARDRLQEALYRLQEDAEQARVTDLRDSRLKPSKKPIGMARCRDRIAGCPAWSGHRGVARAGQGGQRNRRHGELFSMLLGLTGQ